MNRCNWCGKLMWPWQVEKWYPMHWDCMGIVKRFEDMGMDDVVQQSSYIHKKIRADCKEREQKPTNKPLARMLKRWGNGR